MQLAIHHLVLRTIQAVDWSQEADLPSKRLKLLSEAFGQSWRPQLTVECSAAVCSLPSAAFFIASASAEDPLKVVHSAVCAEGVWHPTDRFSTVSELVGWDLADDPIALVISGWRGIPDSLLLSSGTIVKSIKKGPNVRLIRAALPPHPTAGALLQKGQIAAGYADGSIYVLDDKAKTRCIAKPEGAAIVGLAPSPRTRMVAVSGNGRVRSWRTDDFSQIKSIELPESVTAFAVDTDHEAGIILGFDSGFIEELDWDLMSRQRVFHSPAPVHALYVLRNLAMAAVSGSCLKEWARHSNYPLLYEWDCESLKGDNLSSLTVTYEDRTQSMDEHHRYVVTADRSGGVRAQLISQLAEKYLRRYNQIEKEASW